MLRKLQHKLSPLHNPEGITWRKQQFAPRDPKPCQCDLDLVVSELSLQSREHKEPPEYSHVELQHHVTRTKKTPTARSQRSRDRLAKLKRQVETRMYAHIPFSPRESLQVLTHTRGQGSCVALGLWPFHTCLCSTAHARRHVSLPRPSSNAGNAGGSGRAAARRHAS